MNQEKELKAQIKQSGDTVGRTHEKVRCLAGQAFDIEKRVERLIRLPSLRGAN